jgi:hypothetical protein
MLLFGFHFTPTHAPAPHQRQAEEEKAIVVAGIHHTKLTHPPTCDHWSSPMDQQNADVIGPPPCSGVQTMIVWSFPFPSHSFTYIHPRHRLKHTRQKLRVRASMEEWVYAFQNRIEIHRLGDCHCKESFFTSTDPNQTHLPRPSHLFSLSS